jgi:hypothetical protein
MGWSAMFYRNNDDAIHCTKSGFGNLSSDKAFLWTIQNNEAH